MNPDLAARRPDRLIPRDAGGVSRDYTVPRHKSYMFSQAYLNLPETVKVEEKEVRLG